MTATDITKPQLSADERDLHRHINSSYGLAIAVGMRHMNVYQGTFREGAYTKRRTRNRLARISRRINRKH
jgi:hypothetical protein